MCIRDRSKPLHAADSATCAAELYARDRAHQLLRLHAGRQLAAAQVAASDSSALLDVTVHQLQRGQQPPPRHERQGAVYVLLFGCGKWYVGQSLVRAVLWHTQWVCSACTALPVLCAAVACIHALCFFCTARITAAAATTTPPHPTGSSTAPGCSSEAPWRWWCEAVHVCAD